MKDWLVVIATLSKVLGIGVLLIIGVGALSYGVQWIWAQLSFGFSGLILGILIIAATFYLTKRNSKNQKLDLDLDSIMHLKIHSIIGFLYGFGIIFAAILWFFLPASVINSLPAFGSFFYYSIFWGILFAGTVLSIRQWAYGFENNVLASLFLLGISGFFLIFLNYPIWGAIKNIPTNYQLIGILIFAFLIFFQILSVVFFAVIPARQDKLRDESEVQRRSKEH